jgi:hypothetical protein
VVTEIALYIEGGGDQRDTKNALREGFGSFLDELNQIARQHRVRWRIVACGSRNEAFSDFCTAVAQNPGAFNVLLVDAEQSIASAVAGSECHKLPWTHLKDRDGWNRPHGVYHTQCILMIQCMEAWLIADRNNLATYYGPKFKINALPHAADVERIDKSALYEALKKATRDCKNEYHKTRHAFDILRKADPSIVRNAAPHCNRLFHLLAAAMDAVV